MKIRFQLHVNVPYVSEPICKYQSQRNREKDLESLLQRQDRRPLRARDRRGGLHDARAAFVESRECYALVRSKIAPVARHPYMIFRRRRRELSELVKGLLSIP